jgi:predicted transcriptional regulator
LARQYDEDAPGSEGVFLSKGQRFKVMDNEPEVAKDDPQTLLRWSTDIVAAYVAQNTLPAAALASLISSVHQTLSGLGAAPEPEPERRKPAVPISRSVQHDYIVCLEDGKKLKMLKRYLRSRYDLSPEAYRRKWGLAPDYPMVAPAYAERRSNFAKKIGLGRGVRRRKA